MVSFHQWKNIPFEYHDKKDNVMKKSKRWEKVEKSETAYIVMNLFKTDFNLYMKHVYRDQHQQDYFRDTKANLKEGELYLHVDWAENYNKKKQREIQSAYFGASQQEVSLHTGEHGFTLKLHFSKNYYHEIIFVMFLLQVWLTWLMMRSRPSALSLTVTNTVHLISWLILSL
jgi:hypothetical protein